MLKVLSTKLKSEEIDRFEEMAQREGELKSGLLRRLALDYVDVGRKTDTVTSTGTSNPASSLKEDLLAHCEDSDNESLSPVRYEPQTRTLESSAVDSGLPVHEDVPYLLNPAPLPASREPVYRTIKPSGTVTSLKRSSGIGWLIVGGLIVWGLQLESTRVVDLDAAPVRRKPLFGRYH